MFDKTNNKNEQPRNHLEAVDRKISGDIYNRIEDVRDAKFGRDSKVPVSSKMIDELFSLRQKTKALSKNCLALSRTIYSQQEKISQLEEKCNDYQDKYHNEHVQKEQLAAFLSEQEPFRKLEQK